MLQCWVDADKITKFRADLPVAGYVFCFWTSCVKGLERWVIGEQAALHALAEVYSPAR